MFKVVSKRGSFGGELRGRFHLPFSIDGGPATSASLANPFGVAVDETRCAPMGLRFTDPAGGGFEWVDRFRPGIWPETNNVAVTRTNADTWVVTVDPEAGAATRPGFGDCTVLVRRKFSKGKPGTIIEGFFRVPFQFTITRLQ